MQRTPSSSTFSSVRRRWWLVASALAGLAGFGLLPLAKGESSEFKPSSGQAGKDVIWVPTPDALVTQMLTMAEVGADDFVIDLGAGDGKIVLAAAQQFGAQGLGIEYNPEMVALAQRRAEEAGLTERVSFVEADIFASDFSRATVLTLYLLPQLNLRLRPTILGLRPGTRVVSHEFRMEDWEPDQSARVENANAHLWIVPANFSGRWQLQLPAEAGAGQLELSIQQRFQTFEGEARLAGFTAPLRPEKIIGAQIAFGLRDAQGQLQSFSARLQGDALQGVLEIGDQRLQFSGTRIGAPEPIDAPVAGYDRDGRSHRRA